MRNGEACVCVTSALPGTGLWRYKTHMNKHDPGGPEATLRYGDNEITIVRQGLFVRCAMTGERILLDDLRYWSVDLQEAYRGPEEATQRWAQTQTKAKP